MAELELHDRGYEPGGPYTKSAIEQCHERGLLLNAYILWAADIDAVAAYCEEREWFHRTLVGCRMLGIDYMSYIKAERDMRLLGCYPHQALFLATRRIKGGRKIVMIPDSTALLKQMEKDDLKRLL